MRYIDVLETCVEHHNADVTYGHFSPILWMSPSKFYANVESIYIYISICLPIANIEKTII